MSHPLFRPRWILIHLGLASLTATMIFLGFWQLNRLDQKQTTNANVIARTAIAPTAVEEVLASASTQSFGSYDNLEWRVATAKGRFLPSADAIIINRSQDAIAGFSPASAFLLDSGSVVFVNRGFVPLAQSVPPPTPESVSIMGYLRTTQSRTALGAVDSTDPSTIEFHRIDLNLLSQRVQQPSLPMYLQLIEQSPPLTSPWPAPTRLPELTEGSHLSYAVQWWFFSLVSLTGWFVVSRRAIKQRSKATTSQE